LRAIERYDIDILSHPNNGIRTHVLEIAKACKYYGTYVELNGKGNHMTDTEIEKMIEMGVDFIIDSDAHSPDRVGEISKPQAIVDRLHIPEERLANWDKLPRFRSRIKKGLYE
jgi:putative hydrolase